MPQRRISRPSGTRSISDPSQSFPSGNGGAPGVLSSGVPGLDSVMAGGYPQNHVFLIEGDSGTGKTTLALQFLLDGVRRGERGLYITRGLLDGRAQLHLDSTES